MGFAQLAQLGKEGKKGNTKALKAKVSPLQQLKVEIPGLPIKLLDKPGKKGQSQKLATLPLIKGKLGAPTEPPKDAQQPKDGQPISIVPQQGSQDNQLQPGPEASSQPLLGQTEPPKDGQAEPPKDGQPQTVQQPEAQPGNVKPPEATVPAGQKDVDQKSDTSKKSGKSKGKTTGVPLGFKDKTSYLAGVTEKKENLARINSAVRKRKILRYIYYFLILGITAATITLAAIFLHIQDRITYSANTPIKLAVDNCTIFIYDKPSDSTVSTPVYIDYRVPRGLDFDNGGSSVSPQTGNNPEEVTFKNAFSGYISNCYVKLYVEPNTQLGDITINCERCTLTQDSQTLKAGNMVLTGKEFNMTAKDLSLNSLSYTSDNGFLQLSHIVTTAPNTINMNVFGDVIIQSSTDLTVAATTDSQAFCFAGPTVTHKSSSNCAIFSDPASYSKNQTLNCQVEYDVCGAACSSPIKYTVKNLQGNIYANRIPAAGQNLATGYKSEYGWTYSEGIRLSNYAASQIGNFTYLVNDTTKNSPMIILNLGSIESRSAQSTKWILTANPAYAYMKPWWMSIFSATILTNYQQQLQGSLLPGFCPYNSVYNLEQMYKIQNSILANASYQHAIATFVVDQSGTAPTATNPASDGILRYSDDRAPFDYWYSVFQHADGSYGLLDNDINEKLIILFAIIVSLIIACYMTFLLTEIFIIAVNMMYYKIVGFANHLDSYSKLNKKKVDLLIEKEVEPESHHHSKRHRRKKGKEPKKKEDDSVAKYTFKNIMKKAPSLSAFIDYLALILYRQFSNSVDQFYRLLFREVEGVRDDEAPDPNKDMIKGTEAKILYEKFCFMNHLVEQKLGDKNNLALLKKYGYDIVTRNDLLSEVFTRVNVKNYDNFLVQVPSGEEKVDTLKLYMDSNVEITAFEEDQVEVDTFIKLYYNFCDYNRLNRILISPALMKNEYKIESKNVPQQFIMIQEEQDDFRTYGQKGMIDRWKECLRIKRKKKTKQYILDKSKLEDHFSLRLGNTLPQDRLESATIDLILYKRWWIWDFITVLIHMLVAMIVTVPLLILVIVMESQYTPFSLKDPEILIVSEDFSRDIGVLLNKLFFTFGWNIAIVVIVCIFWVMSFLDIMLYYSVMSFPQDKSFTKSEQQENAILRFSRRLEWILITTALMFYFGYIGLILVWLLLGAIINPNAFLPFTSAAVTLVTFCKTKYTEFKNLSKDGTKKIMEFLDKMFGGVITKVINKISQSLDQAAGFVANKGKALMKSDMFKKVSGKLAETGIIDAETLQNLQNKVDALDPKAIIAGAVAVARDPMMIQREMEAMAKEVKDKAILKVKQECKKREIPEELVALVLAIATKK